MEKVFLVGLGGFIGTVCRYGLGGWVSRSKGGATFPYGTLLVNVLGCLMIGLLAALSETRGVFTGTTRAFLFIGVLGGFTTFSSFGYETFQLLRGGQAVGAALNVSLQIALGIGAVWTGDVLARAVWGHGR
jgi:CrcB protein